MGEAELGDRVVQGRRHPGTTSPRCRSRATPRLATATACPPAACRRTAAAGQAGRACRGRQARVARDRHRGTCRAGVSAALTPRSPSSGLTHEARRSGPARPCRSLADARVTGPAFGRAWSPRHPDRMATARLLPKPPPPLELTRRAEPPRRTPLAPHHLCGRRNNLVSLRGLPDRVVPECLCLHAHSPRCRDQTPERAFVDRVRQAQVGLTGELTNGVVVDDRRLRSTMTNYVYLAAPRRKASATRRSGPRPCSALRDIAFTEISITGCGEAAKARLRHLPVAAAPTSA